MLYGLGNLANESGLLQISVSVTPAQIIGNAAGELSHTNGITLVPAVTGALILFSHCLLQYTYSTATYGAGTNSTIRYTGSAGSAISGNIPAATFLGDTSSNSTIVWGMGAAVSILDASTATGFVGEPVVLYCGTQFTNPGTAAGTLVATTFYRLITL